MNTNEICVAQKNAILAAMREHNIPHIQADYSGSGDSGQVAEVEVPGQINPQLSFPVLVSNFSSDDNTWHRRIEIVPMSLEIAMDIFVETLIAHNGHSGFENNEGGGGTVILNATSEKYVHDHYDYVVETVDSSHEG